MFRLCFLFIFLCFVQSSDELIITWDESYKLSWTDFRGKPQQHADAAAVTASGITFGFSVRQSNNRVIDFTTEVHAHFYPEQSWYNTQKATPHILAHEQLHFDITELHARKFRYRIAQLQISNNVPKELRAIHRAINKELEDLQNRYDAETDFSRNVEAQNKWQEYILKELKKLEAYKSSE